MQEASFRVGVLGAGGLGRSAVSIIEKKKECRLVAICDSHGVAYNDAGIGSEDIQEAGTVADIPGIGIKTDDPLGEMIRLKDKIDGIIVALPNLPNEFIPDVVKRFAEAGCCWAFADALKRTRAMKLLFDLDSDLKQIGVTYITGAGATPGLLTTAAVIAAQSFVEVEGVDIWWGVGISSWNQYRATVREDIAHLPGYSVERAKAMSDEEVERLLDEREGKLELHQMEHADDILLERAGVVDSPDKVEVGGIIDTRSCKKPVSTTMTLTGKTFDGRQSSHRFVLGDDTSMAANVIGPALGYLKRALWLRDKSIHGVFGSTEFLPMVVH
jgi:hypothetical protein